MTSLVYFIQSQDGLIKIGWTSDLARRVNNLAVGASGPISVLATTPGGRTLEAHLHERFASDREQGEWFRPSDDLRSLIRLILSGATDVFAHGLVDTIEIDNSVGARGHRAEEATRYARRILDLEIERGLSVREGIARIAQKLNVANGAITALLYRSPSNVPADLYFDLRGLLADHLRSKLADLRNELTAIRHRQASTMTSEDLTEIDAEVARIREKIAAFREATDAYRLRPDHQPRGASHERDALAELHQHRDRERYRVLASHRAPLRRRVSEGLAEPGAPTPHA